MTSLTLLSETGDLLYNTGQAMQLICLYAQLLGSELATKIALAGLKQPFSFCSVMTYVGEVAFVKKK